METRVHVFAHITLSYSRMHEILVSGDFPVKRISLPTELKKLSIDI